MKTIATLLTLVAFMQGPLQADLKIQFTKELDRLWEQVRPLYVSLHAYVRWKLHEKYGDAVPSKGPIPAHLLGKICWVGDDGFIEDPCYEVVTDLGDLMESAKTTGGDVLTHDQACTDAAAIYHAPNTTGRGMRRSCATLRSFQWGRQRLRRRR